MNHAGRRLGPWLVFAALGLVSVAEWRRETLIHESEQGARFRALVERLTLAIEERAHSYEDAIWAAKGHVLSSHSALTRDRWRRYTDLLRLRERYPGINGIGLGHYVPAREKPEYERRNRQLNAEPGFALKPPGERKDYFPITYIEPFELNAAAVGYDLGYEERRRTAVEKSRDLDIPTITSRIELISDEMKRPGFLLLLPIYDESMKIDTVEQRRQAYFGYVYAPFVLENFMKGLVDEREATLSLYDGESKNEPELLFRTGHGPSPRPWFSETTRVRIADRVWTAHWESSERFGAGQGRWQPWLILAGGLAISFLISGWLGVLMRTNRRATALADKMTEELRISQAKVISASKFSALGEMAAGVAHEINNPLTVIQGYAGQLIALARKGTLDPERISHAGEKLIKTSDRIAKIVQGLRTYAREGAGDPFEPARISKIVEETLGFCQSRFKHHEVDLRIGAVPETLSIECREVQISQVLLNLLNNAFDAVRGSANSWVSIEARDQGPNVRIEITDSGRGIPDEVAEKIFQPFFTTKEVGKGTGLGLSLSIGICQQHHGTLELDRTCPNTRFVLTLPKVQPSSPPA